MERLKLYNRLVFVSVKISGDVGVLLMSYPHRCAFAGTLEVEAFKHKRLVQIENKN